jgi:hypothetical protein
MLFSFLKQYKPVQELEPFQVVFTIGAEGVEFEYADEDRETNRKRRKPASTSPARPPNHAPDGSEKPRARHERRRKRKAAQYRAFLKNKVKRFSCEKSEKTLGL